MPASPRTAPSEPKAKPRVRARPTPPPASPSRNEKLAFAGVLAATLLTYASTISFGWVYDDSAQILNNPELHWRRIGFLFSHQLWAYLPNAEARFYRPLLSLWFLLNRSVFGLNAPGFHLTTVLAHVAATALAYVVAQRLLRDSGAALIVAAIFGLHPLHVETAAWISDVDDSLAAVFCFTSFLAYLKTREQPAKAKIWWTVSLVCYAASLLTKEVTMLLPAIILIDLVTRRKPKRRRTVELAAIGYAGVALAFLIARRAVLGSWGGGQQSVPLAIRLLTAPRLAIFYLQKLVLPIGLSTQYQPEQVSKITSPDFLLPLALLGLVLGAGLALRNELRQQQSRSGIFVLGLAWLVVPILPALDFSLLVQHDPLHDRYAYLSIFGAALMAAAAFLALRDRWANINLARPVFIGFAAAMAFASAIQAQYWANDGALFARAVAIAPRNPWAHWNYGAALSSRGQYAEAMAEFARSFSLVPDSRTAAYAGAAAERLERWPEAEQWFRRSLELDDENATSWFDLGHIYLAQNRAAHAVPYLKRAVQLAPAAAGYHYDLAVALEESGRTDEAMEQYRAELAAHPEQRGAQERLRRLETTPPTSAR
ncbi:MAG TPA: tetratricopeptide repeat protein [Terriglobales bacterium]|nr:tetratricopeptide repeat protein [Terriglobales bacterium]